MKKRYSKETGEISQKDKNWETPFKDESKRHKLTREDRIKGIVKISKDPYNIIKKELTVKKIMGGGAFHKDTYFPKNTNIGRLLKAYGVDDPRERVSIYNTLAALLREYNNGEISEINKLENLMLILEPKVTDILNKKLGKMSENEIKVLRLIKDIMVDLHKIKHGEKRINLNASYDNIRKKMFVVSYDNSGNK